MTQITDNLRLVNTILDTEWLDLPVDSEFLLLGDKEIIGLAVVTPWNEWTALVTVKILKKYTEEKDLHKEELTALLSWLKKSTYYGRAISVTHDKGLIATLQRGGFRREGLLKDSYEEDGVTQDQTIVGVYL